MLNPSILLTLWSGRGDLNSGPPEPHSGALPGCATSRKKGDYGASFVLCQEINNLQQLQFFRTYLLIGIGAGLGGLGGGNGR